MRIITWNTLHIQHELKYVGKKSPVIKAFPNEQQRIEKIVQTIEENFVDTIVCLQEVSLQLLELLNKLNQNIFSFQTRESPPEFLVTLCPVPNSKLITNLQFSEGKGCLIVSCNDTLIANVHLPCGFRNRIRCLSDVLLFSPTIICGDMNVEGFFLERELRLLLISCKLQPYMVFETQDKETRKSIKANRFVYQKLDHFITCLNIKTVRTLGRLHQDLSDHYPIIAFI